MAEIYIETGNRIEIPQASPDYPPALLDLQDPPECLYVQGDAAALRPDLAIIGARRAAAARRWWSSDAARTSFTRSAPRTSSSASCRKEAPSSRSSPGAPLR